MSNTSTFQLVREWAEARNLIAGATPQAQFVKLVEEISEYTQGHTDFNFAEVLDGLGDSVVVLTVLAAQLGTDIETCIATLDDELDAANQFGGLLEKSQSVEQLMFKLMNSLGRFATGISKKDMTKVQTGIGGVYRVLEAITYRYDHTTEQVFAMAYDVIKDRKGRMIDGVFVKEADLANYGIAS
jgi:hypothetical protein